MNTDINTIIDDLGHASLHSFIFLENIIVTDGSLLEKTYLNEASDGVFIKLKLSFPYNYGKIIEDNLELTASLNIEINNQTIIYSEKFTQISNNLNINNLVEIEGFSEYFNDFKNNIRLFNGEAF